MSAMCARKTVIVESVLFASSRRLRADFISRTREVRKSELYKQVTTNSMSIFGLMTTTPVAVATPAECATAATKGLNSKNQGCVWVLQQVSLCFACSGGLVLTQKVAVVLAAVSLVGCASGIVDHVVPCNIIF